MTPLVIVELLPNDPNIKKDHYWSFVPLPIADIQVPSSIQIIQLFNCYTYLWDKKVPLSITNAVKRPSLTKNKGAVFSLTKPHFWHFPFKVMMENSYFFGSIELLPPNDDFAKEIKTKTKQIKLFIWSCASWHLQIPWRSKCSLNLHQEPDKIISLIQQKFNFVWIQTSIWWIFLIPFSCLIPLKAISSKAFILDSTSALPI